MNNIIELRHEVTDADTNKKASLLLADLSGLSQGKIKEAMSKGAVWVQKKNKRQRLRRASKQLNTGDIIELFYDPKILSATIIEPQLIADEGDYSLWFKPYGLSCQGSRWGDFSSINRQVEAYFDSQRSVFLVHRLDNATSGIILLAHSKTAAKAMSELFSQRLVDKRYQAIVAGDLSSIQEWQEITLPVEGKTASTLICCAGSNQRNSLLNVRLNTGRKHQIRLHLASIDHPIIGDRLYGNAKEGERDLQLQAQHLRFICPLTSVPRDYQIDEALMLRLF